MLKEVRSEPQSRKLPQSDVGGIRDRTTAKEPVVRRKKTLTDEATRARGPREGHARQQGKIKRTESAQPTAVRQVHCQEADKSKANSRQTRAKPTASKKSIEDLEEDWKDSKSNTVKESVAKSKAETTPKSEPKATTKPKAEPTAETNRCQSEIVTQTFPRLQNRSDWEFSNRVGSWRQMRREK